MNYIEFDVESIGHFKAKQELSIIEESRIDTISDDLLNGKLYELIARAEQLKKVDIKTAKDLKLQIQIIQMIAELEIVIIEMPESIKHIRDIRKYADLFLIWNAYKKKVKDLTEEKDK